MKQKEKTKVLFLFEQKNMQLMLIYQVNWHVNASECERCQSELLGLGLNVVHQLEDGQPEQEFKKINIKFLCFLRK